MQQDGRALAFGALVILLAVQAVFLQRSGPAGRLLALDAAASAPSGAMDILPTLKGHMARLESHMNRLFRDIDDPEHREELISITRAMSEHLRRVEHFKPEKIEWMADAGKERAAMQRFHDCLARARDQLARLGDALSGGGADAPKSVLLELDATRRTCHAEFG